MPCNRLDLIPCLHFNRLCQVSVTVHNIVNPLIYLPQISCNAADNQAKQHDCRHKAPSAYHNHIAHCIIDCCHNRSCIIITADRADYFIFRIINRYICRNRRNAPFCGDLIVFINLSILKHRFQLRIRLVKLDTDILMIFLV